jgi:hypothetical protein
MVSNPAGGTRRPPIPRAEPARTGGSLVANRNPGDMPAARALVTEAAAESGRLDLPGPLAAADGLVARIDSAPHADNPLSPR